MIDFLLDTTSTSAKALASWPSTAWPHLSDSFCVEVYAVHGGWYVSSHFDIRGTGGQWNYGRRVTTQGEAAPLAADVFAECARLMSAQHRGEPLRHPGDVMADAWEATPEAARLEAAMEESRARRLDVLSNDTLWREARAETERLRTELHDARAAWFAAQDWRAHRDAAPIAHRDAKPDNVEQLGLFEVAS